MSFEHLQGGIIKTDLLVKNAFVKMDLEFVSERC